MNEPVPPSPMTSVVAENAVPFQRIGAIAAGVAPRDCVRTSEALPSVSVPLSALNPLLCVKTPVPPSPTISLVALIKPVTNS